MSLWPLMIEDKRAYRLPTFDDQSIELEELTDDRLSLSRPRHSSASSSVSCVRPSLVDVLASDKKDTPTFIICNSCKPFCMSSWTRRASCSSRCSRKASPARLLPYSRKLYAANCWLCRSRERYCSIVNSRWKDRWKDGLPMIALGRALRRGPAVPRT